MNSDFTFKAPAPVLDNKSYSFKNFDQFGVRDSNVQYFESNDSKKIDRKNNEKYERNTINSNSVNSLNESSSVNIGNNLTNKKKAFQNVDITIIDTDPNLNTNNKAIKNGNGLNNGINSNNQIDIEEVNNLNTNANVNSNVNLINNKSLYYHNNTVNSDKNKDLVVANQSNSINGEGINYKVSDSDVVRPERPEGNAETEGFNKAKEDLKKAKEDLKIEGIKNKEIKIEPIKVIIATDEDKIIKKEPSLKVVNIVTDDSIINKSIDSNMNEKESIYLKESTQSKKSNLKLKEMNNKKLKDKFRALATKKELVNGQLIKSNSESNLQINGEVSINKETEKENEKEKEKEKKTQKDKLSSDSFKAKKEKIFNILKEKELKDKVKKDKESEDQKEAITTNLVEASVPVPVSVSVPVPVSVSVSVPVPVSVSVPVSISVTVSNNSQNISDIDSSKQINGVRSASQLKINKCRANLQKAREKVKTDKSKSNDTSPIMSQKILNMKILLEQQMLGNIKKNNEKDIGDEIISKFEEDNNPQSNTNINNEINSNTNIYVAMILEKPLLKIKTRQKKKKISLKL